MNTNIVGSAGFNAWLEFLLFYNVTPLNELVTICVYFRSVAPDTVNVSA